MAEARAERRLAAILATDVVGYSRLMGGDERAPSLHSNPCADPSSTRRSRSIAAASSSLRATARWWSSQVPSMRFVAPSKFSARCRNEMPIPPDKKIEFRIGINVGDIIVDGTISWRWRQCRGADRGHFRAGRHLHFGCGYRQVTVEVDAKFRRFWRAEPQEHRAARARLRLELAQKGRARRRSTAAKPAQPDKPSIAVLAFNNMSGDPEQEYFLTASAKTLSPIYRSCRVCTSSRATRPLPTKARRST